MQKKVREFLAAPYGKDDYFGVLQKFLKKRLDKGRSVHTIARLYYNLYPIGETLDNPPIDEVSRDWLKQYVDKQWLEYAPETMRTFIGDVRQFFKWCKKKRHLPKNIAKSIKPVRKRKRRNRRAKAAPEADMQSLMTHLADQLKNDGLVYRGFFKNLQAAESGWTDESIRTLRDLFIITFLYETGVRAGELSTLGTRTMQEATKTLAAAYMITVVGKTDDRDYSFTNHTAELWHIWQQVRPDGGGSMPSLAGAAITNPTASSPTASAKCL